MTTPVTAADRTLAAMRALIASVFPSLRFYLAHEYSVQGSDGATFSGVPTDPTFSPALPTRVPYSPSLAGSSAVVPNGALAHVVFINGDPSKPRCVGFDLPTIPTSVAVDATGTASIGTSASSVVLAAATPVITSPAAATLQRRVVCYGDTVSVGGSAIGPVTLVAATCSKASA